MLPLQGLDNVISLAYDQVTKALYFTDVRHNTIRRAFLDGSGKQDTLHDRTVGSPEGK